LARNGRYGIGGGVDDRVALIRNLAAAIVLAVLCFQSKSTAAHAASAYAVKNICHPKLVSSDVVATHEQRERAGKKARPKGIGGPTGFDWSDTQLGVVKSRDRRRYLFFGSDGSCHANCGDLSERDGSITRTAGSLDDPLGIDAPYETILPQSLQLGQHSVVYVGGGPVTRVPIGHPGAGNLLLVYTAARWTNLEQKDGEYEFTGLAKSTDDGFSWTDLGLILSANQRFRPGAPPAYNSFDEGLGNLVADPAGLYYYIYFPDKVTKGGFHGSHDTFFSVARVSMDQLLHRAFDRDVPGALPSFEKYYDGNWDQPGLGGLSTSILNPQSDAGDPNVAWSDYLKRYVVIFDDTEDISYAESSDGIHWAPTLPLLSLSPDKASALYAIPVGLGDDSTVVGRQFYIYYTYYPSPRQSRGGWIDASIRRLGIECNT
jgi:hypothetical protein